VALLVSAPWVGWRKFGLLALSALDFTNVERRTCTSVHSERVSACGILVTLLLMVSGIACKRRAAQSDAVLAGACRRDGRGALSPAGRDRGAGAHGARDWGGELRARGGSCQIRCP